MNYLTGVGLSKVKSLFHYWNDLGEYALYRDNEERIDHPAPSNVNSSRNTDIDRSHPGWLIDALDRENSIGAALTYTNDTEQAESSKCALLKGK